MLYNFQIKAAYSNMRYMCLHIILNVVYLFLLDVHNRIFLMYLKLGNTMIIYNLIILLVYLHFISARYIALAGTLMHEGEIGI